MKERPSESLKPIADNLSRLINANGIKHAEISGLLKELSINGNGDSPEQNGYSPEHHGDTLDLTNQENSIGIWKKCVENGETFYERDFDKSSDWLRWANKHRIGKKKNAKRIILLGESVARGYLYDPHYNVALELEAIINAVFSPSYCEVIDLARTSITMDALLEVTKSCIGMDPDAIILFAGNNWIPKARKAVSEADYKEMFEIFKKESIAGVNAFLERKFESLIASFLREIEVNIIRKKIPVVFVIPGFNLQDWKSDEAGKNLLWLPENAVSDWLKARETAEKALAEKQYDLLEQAAQQMVRIDPFNPVGYELLGESYINEGKRDEALKCLESSRDTMLIGRGGNEHPRCVGIIRKAILDNAPGLGIRVVDLPQIFNHLSPDKIPGRSLFLDYCHLTVEGIKIAMRYAAEKLIPLISDKEIPVNGIKAAEIYPGNEVVSIAHFCAAIHNAHSGQRKDILSYHCQQSLFYSKNVKELMLEYIDFTNRYAPTVLCKAYEEIIFGGRMRQYEGGFALRPGEGKKLLDLELVDAISESLHSAGIAVADDITQLRKQEHRIGREKANLLESFYCMTSFRDLEIGPKRGFAQARSTETFFSFIADPDQSLVFDLVYRTPKRFHPGKFVNILINGSNNTGIELPMSEKWVKRSFTIDQNFLHDGVNKLTIKWPYTFEPLEKIDEIDLAGSFLHVILPVLGEIHTFTAVSAQ